MSRGKDTRQQGVSFREVLLNIVPGRKARRNAALLQQRSSEAVAQNYQELVSQGQRVAQGDSQSLLEQRFNEAVAQNYQQLVALGKRHMQGDSAAFAELLRRTDEVAQTVHPQSAVGQAFIKYGLLRPDEFVRNEENK